MNYLIKQVRSDREGQSGIRVIRTGKWCRCWRHYGMRPKYYGKSWFFAEVITTGGKA